MTGKYLLAAATTNKTNAIRRSLLYFRYNRNSIITNASIANGTYVLGFVKNAAGIILTIVSTNIAHSGIFL
jgi:hypothetical protein